MNNLIVKLDLDSIIIIYYLNVDLVCKQNLSVLYSCLLRSIILIYFPFPTIYDYVFHCL